MRNSVCAGVFPRQKRSRATSTIPGQLGLAAVGIEQPDGGVEFRAGGAIDEHPAIRAHAGIAIADRHGDFRQRRGGRVLNIGQEEIVLRAVQLGVREFH